MHTDSPITWCLMLLILLFSTIGLFNKTTFSLLILHPYGIIKNKEFWRLFTSDLVHNDWVHLMVNEYMLYISCSRLEFYLKSSSAYGMWEFLFIYACSYFTGVIVTTFRYKDDFNFSTAGASGSIMGCLFSFILLEPNLSAFYVPGFGMVKNIYGGLMYILIMIWYQRKSENRMADHELHFFSSLGGIAATLVLYPHSL